MIDRMDIDALLIGALYGELTPADEARLTAHLESHPADRTALADLTRTRAAVRDSRILAVQLEPPQSVSALLLQEAARRAPRPQREASSWFHRFARSFLAHPALAGAMTCVIVAGVAGTLYVRHGAKFAEDSTASRATVDSAPDPAAASPALPPSEAPVAPVQAPAPATPPAAAVAPRPASPAPERRGAGAKREDLGADKGVAAHSSEDAKAYRVRLDELAAKQADERPRGKLAGRAKDTTRDSDDALSEGAADRVKPAAADAEMKKAQPQKKSKGIELRSPEPQPRELANKAGGRGDASGAGGNAAADDLAQAPSAGAPPPPSAQPAPPPQSVANNAAPSPTKPAVVAKAVKPDAGRTENAPPKRAVAGPGAPQGAQGSPSNTANSGAGTASAQRNERRLADQNAAPADGKQLEEKERANDTVLGWAQKQRDQVIAHVRSNNCRAAATAAVEIYNRAPDYYASNVATDRSIKPCLAYLNTERQREDRARAAKRANAVDAAPSQAAEQPQSKK